MKRLLYTGIVVLVFNILPLLGSPELILHFKNIIIACATALVWITQPTFSVDETKNNRSQDKFTILLIVIMLFPSLMLSIIIWAYFSDSNSFDLLFTDIGILLIAFGVLLRIWAIYILGKRFTATVRFETEHELVSKGPYKYIRHPSYTGAFIAILGCSVLLHTYVGIIMSSIAMFIAYYFRIKVEEKALIDQFGSSYQHYQTKTFKMIPFLW